nr:flagellar protein FlaG [Desulfobulbaceae bacterium]
MEVGANTDVRGYGNQANQTAVPVVEKEDRTRPQVQPVKGDTNSGKVALNEQALHGRGKEKQAKKMSSEDLESVMAEVQQRLDAIGGNLRLGLQQYKETNDIIVEVRDKSSDKVVKQFPSEELLTLKSKLKDLVGLLVDESA